MTILLQVLHRAPVTGTFDVVNHYNGCFNLGLADQQKADLVEFLKSISGTRTN